MSIRIVLAIQSLLMREAFCRKLQSCPDLAVVAAVNSPVELLRTVDREKADVVISETDDTHEVPGVLTHVFAQSPRTLAIALDSRHNRAVVYRRGAAHTVLESVHLADLIGALRSAREGDQEHAP